MRVKAIVIKTASPYEKAQNFMEAKSFEIYWYW